jgi:excinuclease ABC subunit A
LLDLPEGTRLMILAPLVRGRKGEHREVFERVRKAGFARVRVDGKVYDAQEPPELVRQKAHHIEAVVDRIVVREGVRGRLAESVQLAIKPHSLSGGRHAEGLIIGSHEEGRKSGRWVDRLFNTRLSCPNCRISYEELEPRTFSFNSPYGACPRCEGMGSLEGFDPELVVPDWSVAISAGAVVPWKNMPPATEKKIRAQVAGLLASLGLRWNTPLERLDPAGRHAFLHGPSPSGSGKAAKSEQRTLGLLTLLEKQYVTTTSRKKR